MPNRALGQVTHARELLPLPCLGDSAAAARSTAAEPSPSARASRRPPAVVAMVSWPDSESSTMNYFGASSQFLGFEVSISILIDSVVDFVNGFFV